ncbi:MAG TPA: YceI family protein [Anaerolineae bacterium]|nr:YceI family protein [Anaerolineae bacterium]
MAKRDVMIEEEGGAVQVWGRLWWCLFGICLVVLMGWPSAAAAHDGQPHVSSELTPPPPPVLPEATGQKQLYRLDSNQSEARYQVQEQLVGMVEGNLVVGRTQGVEGELLIDWEQPAASQLGLVTIDVETLATDSNLRDKRVRADYLETDMYPVVTFVPVAGQTLPAAFKVGETIRFPLDGYVTVRDVTIIAEWQIELTITPERVVGSAVTTVKMSDFGVGPISIVGLVSTDDEMVLGFDFVALAEGVEADVARSLTAATLPTYEATDLLFSQDIQPILEAKCVGCHVAGELGYGVYQMETAGDVAEVAEDLAFIIHAGYMPPWMPGPEAPKFEDDRSLSAEERAAVLAWAQAGAPLDVAAETVLVGKAAEGDEIRPDIVLQMPEPYMPDGEQADDYRCILLDPGLPEGGYVTGSEVLPDEGRVVHHVLVFQIPASSRAAAEARTAEDEALGWECFGGPSLPASGPGAIGNTVASWVPGMAPRVLKPGTGIEVPPGGLLVLQVHYNYASGVYPDQSKVVLQVEPATADITPLLGLPMVAPVEIPCPVGVTGERCERATAVKERNEEDQQRVEQLLRICGQEVSDYEQQAAARATTYCDWRIPVDGELVYIAGHMHTLGASLRLELNPGTAEAMVLQDLPMWDFNWQGRYAFETPVVVEAGDVVRLTCVWDQGLLPVGVEPQYVVWGEGTADEMCLSVLTMEPAEGVEVGDKSQILLEMVTLFPDWMPVGVRAVLFLMTGRWWMVLAGVVLVVGGYGWWWGVRKGRGGEVVVDY